MGRKRNITEILHGFRLVLPNEVAAHLVRAIGEHLKCSECKLCYPVSATYVPYSEDNTKD